MRHLLPLLSLTGCVAQGVLVVDESPVPREPVTAVVLGEALQTALPDGWGTPLAADMDADGIIDLVAMTDDGDVGWLRGDGSGAFEADILVSARTLRSRVIEQISDEPVTASSATVTALDLVDVDGDGFVDLQLTLRFTDGQPFRTVSGVLFSPTVLVAWQTWADTADHRVTTVADLDGDGHVEWVEFSQTPAIHTSTGQLWPLSDAVSWVYYPQVGALNVAGETVFVTMVDGGFGISQIETWNVTSNGLEPRPSIQGIYAQSVAFGPNRFSISDEVMMVSNTGIERFDGTSIMPATHPNEELSFYAPSMGDFTGDGSLDVLIADGSNPARLHASSTDSLLVDMSLTAPILPGYGMLVADVNGDGLDDLLQVGWEDGGSVLSVWMNES